MQTTMEEALVRILTPRHSIDILRDVHAAKEQRKTYVVVFVGVNGVRKSTNLAKVNKNHIIFSYLFKIICWACLLTGGRYSILFATV